MDDFGTRQRVTLQQKIKSLPRHAILSITSVNAQNERRIVCTARKGSVIWDGDNVETYNRGRLIQLCAYDKRTELFNGMKSESGAQKYALMVRECFGKEWEYKEIPTLRVEFRLRRQVLRDMEINSLDDLLEKEADLVHWLTHKWFRIITEPKKRGHTHEQETSEFWQEVQEAFEKWFPGRSFSLIQ